MKIETLNEVEQEVKRFMSRLKAAKERIKSEPDTYSSMETGAVKRAAIDLKNELSKLNKSRP